MLTVCISCLLILLTFSVSACATDLVRSGIEEYSFATSSDGLTSGLLPYVENEENHEQEYDGFLTKYKYIDGDYRYTYKDDAPFYNTRETVLMWLRYESEVYEEAKAYMLETVPLSAKYRYEYNGYSFIGNLSIVSDRILNQYGDYSDSPNPFLTVGYSDSKNILVFSGVSASFGTQAELLKEILDSSDWGAFLKEYYPFYDFDA